MPEEERLRLEAIQDRIALVFTWTASMTEAEFMAHLLVRDATALSLLVIGETARRLSHQTRAAAPDVPWPAIVALRNRIAHGYETVDHSLVWQIVTQDLPLLNEAMHSLLGAAASPRDQAPTP